MRERAQKTSAIRGGKEEKMQSPKNDIANSRQGQYPLPQEAPLQMPQAPMMPPPQGRKAKTVSVWPKWLSQYAIATYLLALAVVTLIYSSYSLPWYYMLSGVVSVFVFFLYGRKLAQDTSVAHIKKAKNFEKRIFIIAFIPRLLFMLLLYWIFMEYYGDAFGFENADAAYYDEFGQFVAGLIGKGNFHFYDEISRWSGGDDISDMGYGVYVGFIYWLTDNSIIAVRLLKCIWSSFTAVLIYRLSKRNFDEQTARIAALFVALWPNFWYYCSAHLKEVEMVFLTVLFVEQADQMLRSRQFTAWKVIPVLLIAAAIFTFRTPLGLVALLALVFSVAMSSSRVVSWGKRIVVGVFAVALIGIVAGSRIEEQTQGMLRIVQSGDQQRNMEWRSRREHGNNFAKYAGASVFAPMILTLPFPTMVRAYEGQDMQMILNGGNFIKNILSGFVLFAVIILLLSSKWREHLLPLSFMLGYLVVLVFSSFAQSERFHQPIMPFELMFAAYGVSLALSHRRYKRWCLYWCIIMFIAAVAWNWFKLAGRGMV